MRNLYLLKKEAEERKIKRMIRLTYGAIGSAGAGLMSVGFGLLSFIARKGVLTKEDAIPLLIAGIFGGVMLVIGIMLADGPER